MLLYGPSGNGKSLLANALATKCEDKFLSVNLFDLFKFSTLEAKEILNKLFEMAKEINPATIFFDGLELLTDCESESEGEKEREIRLTLVGYMQN